MHDLHKTYQFFSWFIASFPFKATVIYFFYKCWTNFSAILLFLVFLYLGETCVGDNRINPHHILPISIYPGNQIVSLLQSLEPWSIRQG